MLMQGFIAADKLMQEGRTLGSALNILGCQFADNAAELNGGAMYVDGPSQVVSEGNIFSRSIAGQQGMCCLYRGCRAGSQGVQAFIIKCLLRTHTAT